MSTVATQDGLGPFDPYWTDDVPPPRTLRRGWRGRAAFGLAAAIGLVGASLHFSASPTAPSSPNGVAANPSMIETVDANLAPLFAVEAADGARAQYEARVVAATGDRRDLYSVGALGGEGPAVRLEMWKRAKAEPTLSLFVEIAEEAAMFGAAVERLEASQTLAAAQGPVEWAGLTLAGMSRSCVGFRLVARGDAGLRGLACAAPGAKMDAAALSCLLDRIALTAAAHEAGFGELMRSAGVRRPACRATIG
jgi:hypothetical protein